ncbi:MAG: periplasmic heavy metal sensor [Acidobacteriota bacterium]
MKSGFGSSGLTLVLTAASAFAQGGPGGGPPPQPPAAGQQEGPPTGREGRGFGNAPPPLRAGRPPMERAFQAGPGGRWWNNPEMAQKLSLNSDQQKKMDDIFQQNRLKLIDLNATLQKEEIMLEPLVAADSPDEPKILAQIDRVAQARAELEKANARFLLGIRRVLTQDQWKKLQAERPAPGRGPSGPGGPGGGPGGGGPRPQGMGPRGR